MNSGEYAAISKAWQGKRVAVVGDLMLDRYVWGKASRISAEAPVPVVEVQRTTAVPGGSANVLRNLSALGAQAVAFGVVGADSAAQELESILTDLSIDSSGVLTDSSRRTSEKTRVLAGNQQVVRVDTEDLHAIGSDQVEKVIDRLSEQARGPGLDAIIVEDYAKGMLDGSLLDHVVALATDKSIPVALDPHPSHAFRARGLSLLTPNRAEAFALAGRYFEDTILPIEDDQALLDVVAKIHSEWAPHHLLITLGGHGMALFDQGEPSLHIPTRAQEVFDVSGAGDTVIASYMLSLLGGATPEEAAVISNHAAGVVVGKVGTAPATAEEILETYQKEGS
jgi:D-beta-D-heptose 7-phosphate kinase/D-beta-D-heptose 1-phosphate adenosyltransferase